LNPPTCSRDDDVAPVHALIEGQLAALGEQVNLQRDERLAGREDPELRVRPTAEGAVEDHLAVPYHA
jgi:hypothetical protein